MISNYLDSAQNIPVSVSHFLVFILYFSPQTIFCLYRDGNPAALDLLSLYLNPEGMSIDATPSPAIAGSRAAERNPWTGG